MMTLNFINLLTGMAPAPIPDGIGRKNEMDRYQRCPAYSDDNEPLARAQRVAGRRSEIKDALRKAGAKGMRMAQLEARMICHSSDAIRGDIRALLDSGEVRSTGYGPGKPGIYFLNDGAA